MIFNLVNNMYNIIINLYFHFNTKCTQYTIYYFISDITLYREKKFLVFYVNT